ncbi:hypothetical protein [Streptomyces pinistramenti]|uniref:hypothetical protein n=1 Tax=Streptomyces pinistramenti TaxID=2884812 RepID=UPI001D08B072|nr:hypothetical protein [Streptomyces pinistramenti]MCB5906154.1 hypothetical protein [Streptomyces pinistramenti]
MESSGNAPGLGPTLAGITFRCPVTWSPTPAWGPESAAEPISRLTVREEISTALVTAAAPGRDTEMRTRHTNLP